MRRRFSARRAWGRCKAVVVGFVGIGWAESLSGIWGDAVVGFIRVGSGE